MVKTTIESVDATGREVPTDPELKRRVERAAALLETELAQVTAFPIESRWRVVHQPGSAPRVELELTGRGTGVRDWVFDTKGWNEDDQVRRALRAPLWTFADAVSSVVQQNLDRIRRDLDAMTPITEE